MHDVQFLILGAGPTGLGAAWRLAQCNQRDWLLVEATDTPGGLARSIRDEHGFLWDVGCHVQHGHYDYFEDLMDELLGIDGWYYHDRETWVWLKDRFVPYPFQLNLHRLPEEDLWTCVRGLISAAAASAEGPPANFGEWIDKMFGRGIGDIFLRPYNTKIWACPPEQMNCTWIGDRVALTDIARVVRNIRDSHDDVSWGPNSRFRFPKVGGTGAVWRRFAALIEQRMPCHMRFEQPATRIDTAGHRVIFADGTSMTYRHLISTMPLDVLIERSDLAATHRTDAAKLRHSSTHVIGIALHGQAPTSIAGKSWMYYPEDNCPFYRLTHFSQYSPSNVPDASRQWSLIAEVSEAPERPRDAAATVAGTIDGLVATRLIDSPAQVHHMWHQRFGHGYPIPSLERDTALNVLLPALARRGVYSRGRFGAWKYEVANQDHSLAQGVEVIDALLRGEEEVTLNRPDVVNARPSARPPVAAWRV
jgi:protoporphyrinogen oxidase